MKMWRACLLCAPFMLACAGEPTAPEDCLKALESSFVAGDGEAADWRARLIEIEGSAPPDSAVGLVVAVAPGGSASLEPWLAERHGRVRYAFELLDGYFGIELPAGRLTELIGAPFLTQNPHVRPVYIAPTGGVGLLGSECRLR